MYDYISLVRERELSQEQGYVRGRKNFPYGGKYVAQRMGKDFPYRKGQYYPTYTREYYIEYNREYYTRTYVRVMFLSVIVKLSLQA